MRSFKWLLVPAYFVLNAATVEAGGGGHGSGGHGVSSPHSGSPVHVNGYTRSDGTYVAPYVRSSPDATLSNNWSTRGNINPYSGVLGNKSDVSSSPLTSGSHLSNIPIAGATSVPNPEELAANCLRVVRPLVADANRRTFARIQLRQIINKYPSTAAASEAQEMLAKLQYRLDSEIEPRTK